MAKIPKPARKKITKEERRAKYTGRARDKRNKLKNKHMICFKCRKPGHTVSECPSADNNNNMGSTNDQQPRYGGAFCTKIVCYKCGSSDHPLKSCPKLTFTEKSLFYQKSKVDYSKMVLPFATCFICKEEGHLSSQCQQNKNGIYVKGGSCRICGGKDHLVMNCPTKQQRANGADDSDDGSVDVEEFLESDDRKGSSNVEEQGDPKKNPIKKKRKAVTF